MSRQEATHPTSFCGVVKFADESDPLGYHGCIVSSNPLHGLVPNPASPSTRLIAHWYHGMPVFDTEQLDPVLLNDFTGPLPPDICFQVTAGVKLELPPDADFSLRDDVEFELLPPTTL